MDSIANIDAEICRLRLQICGLMTRRNQQTFIGRIPNEILSLVFVAFVGGHDCLRASVCGPYWFQLTQVCRRWRQVALCDPSLWTHISSQYGNHITEMLQLSKQLPLKVDIVVTYGRTFMVNGLSKILEEAARIHTLCLSVPSAVILQSAVDLMVQPAGILDTLELEVSSSLDTWLLPNELFAAKIPRLRRLHLHNCGIRWDSPLLTNLTDVAIRLPEYGERVERFSLSVVIGRLRDMPTLRVLRLEYCVISILDGDAASGEPIEPLELPLLEGLHLSDEILTVTSVLGLVRVPCSASISLVCGSSVAEIVDIARLYGTLGRANGGYRETLIRTLCIDRGYDDSGIRFVAYTTECRPSAVMRNTEDADLVVDISWEAEYGGSSLLVNLCRSAHLGGVRELYIFDVDPIADYLWVDVARQMEHLHSIHVRGQGFHGIVGAFRLGAMDQDKNIFMPRVSKLVAERVAFDGDTVGALAQSLRGRVDIGCSVGYVAIKCCVGIDQEDIEMLRAIVTEVEWDGVNGWTSDEDEIDIDIGGRSHYASEYYSTEGED